MSKPTKPSTGKAVVVSSLSLSQHDWNYLKSLAYELVAVDAHTTDPLMFRTPTTSQAVRHLIAEDRRLRRKDKDGNPLFGAGPGQTRMILSDGTTTVQSVEEVVTLAHLPRKKGGTK